MREKLNRLGRDGKAAFFLIDFEGLAPIVLAAEELDKRLRYRIGAHRWRDDESLLEAHLAPRDTAFAPYAARFAALHEEIAAGNCYLANLTARTPLICPHTTEELYRAARAPYKLWLAERFVLFSPEPFIRIEGETIHTFPMKGTIDADLPDARTTLLDDPKELAEHTMTVDLLRNDLSIVADEVRVERFRYIEEIVTARGRLLQTSSHIRGRLSADWRAHLGDLLFDLLPAGSVTGTPKRAAAAILSRLEGEPRGYFTGVFGYFDGRNLESAVAIRFVEEHPEGLFYRSGGGITAESDPRKEYDELLAKIYLPLA